MATVQVSIVHDVSGKIVSISRPGKGAPGRDLNSFVLANEGQSVFVTEVDDEKMGDLLDSHYVDIGRKSLVSMESRAA